MPVLRENAPECNPPEADCAQVGEDQAYLSVREILFLAQPKMVRYSASVTFLAAAASNIRAKIIPNPDVS